MEKALICKKQLFKSYKGSAFNFFKVSLTSKMSLTFNFWNFFLAKSGWSVFNRSLFLNIFNGVKYLKVVNNSNKVSFFLLDRSFLYTKLVFHFYRSLNRSVAALSLGTQSGWFASLNFIGLGYKVFLYKSELYIKLGYCRVLKLRVPIDISVFARRKNRLLFVSTSQESLSTFIHGLKRLRSFDFYKGKGIFEYSSFDGIKLKVGKQQQFY